MKAVYVVTVVASGRRDRECNWFGAKLESCSEYVCHTEESCNKHRVDCLCHRKCEARAEPAKGEHGINHSTRKL